MRKLMLLPLLLLAFACNDSTPVQPEQNLEIAADKDQGRNSRTEYTFQFVFDVTPGRNPLPPSPTEIPDGDLIHFFNTNVFTVVGELEGSAYMWGETTLNTVAKEAHVSGAMMLVLSEPEVGAFTCRFQVSCEQCFESLHVSHGKWDACRGAGAYEGMKMSSTNRAGPPLWWINEASAEIWGGDD